MSLRVTLSHHANEYFAALPTTSHGITGVLIGRVHQSEVNIVKGVSTPTPTDATNETGNPGAPDEEWVLEHIRQVERMLVGGYDIVGIYLSSSKDYLTQYSTSFDQILRNMYNDRASQILASKIVFLANHNGKMTTSFIRVEDKTVSLDKTPFKVVPTRVNGMVSLTSSIKIALDVHVPKKAKNCVEAMNHAVEKEVQRIVESVVVSESGAQQDQLPSKAKQLKMLFLDPFSSKDVDPASNETINESIGRLRISGVVTCRALCPTSSSYSDACNNLKKDAIKSLTDRYSVAIDDLESKGIKLGLNSQQILYLPRRVYLDDTDPIFCDYVTTEEDVSLSIGRFKAILNLQGIEEKSVSQPEHNAPTQTPSPGLIRAQQAADRRQLAKDTPKELPYIFLGVSGLIVLLAVVLALLSRK